MAFLTMLHMLNERANLLHRSSNRSHVLKPDVYKKRVISGVVKWRVSSPENAKELRVNKRRDVMKQTRCIPICRFRGVVVVTGDTSALSYAMLSALCYRIIRDRV